MNGKLFMGIDGGGTGLRVVIVDGGLKVLSSVCSSAANPNLVGREQAQRHIQSSVIHALRQGSIAADDVTTAGIGIAGASVNHSRSWLRETMKPILPNSLLALSSDLEIGLVGALGQRHGILLLAGTGSAAYGLSPSGEKLQIGGWGYLLGDPGSSYWIGMQVLKQIVDSYDTGAKAKSDTLGDYVMRQHNIASPRDIVAWLYRSETAPATLVAGIARFVLERANDGDTQANDILRRAVMHLAGQADALVKRLEYRHAPIAFAGGLLDNSNVLSEALARRLGLKQRPRARYSPVIGAALLAKLEWNRMQS